MRVKPSILAVLAGAAALAGCQTTEEVYKGDKQLADAYYGCVYAKLAAAKSNAPEAVEMAMNGCYEPMHAYAIDLAKQQGVSFKYREWNATYKLEPELRKQTLAQFAPAK